MTVSVLIGGLLLDYVIRYDATPEAVQTPETMFMLKACYVALQSFFTALVFLVLWQYPLSKPRLLEIRTELEQRRPAV